MNYAELSEWLWRFAARIGNVDDALPDTRLGRRVAGHGRKHDKSGDDANRN